MYSHSYSFNPDICLRIHSAECTVRLLNQNSDQNSDHNRKSDHKVNVEIKFYIDSQNFMQNINVNRWLSSILLSEVNFVKIVNEL